MEKRQRKPLRLKGYDYSLNGYYFVTICTQNKECLFGFVGVGRDRPEMNLNNFGKIVQSVWYSLPKHYNVQLDQFQIMPNHLHFILIIKTGASRRAPTLKTIPTLGFIVGIFKSEITKQIHKIINNPDKKIFQRNYYEHIIRNEKELNEIREYIRSNPSMWEKDQDNPLNIKSMI